MTAVLIVLVVLVVIVVVALAVTNPMMRNKEDAAIKAVKDSLGAGSVKVIEPRTTAMGTDPDEAGGVRGMSCLAVNDQELLAVTWSGLKEFRLARSAIVGVETGADDPGAVQKASITITFTTADGSEATAMFRLREPVPWLTELGYDWGPDGPPVTDDDEADDDGAAEADGADETGGSAERDA